MNKLLKTQGDMVGGWFQSVKVKSSAPLKTLHVLTVLNRLHSPNTSTSFRLTGDLDLPVGGGGGAEPLAIIVTQNCKVKI